MRRASKRKWPALVAEIREHMRARGVSQAQLAGRMGISRATVCRWFKCRHEPNFQNLVEMLIILGLDLQIVADAQDTGRAHDQWLVISTQDYTEMLETDEKVGIPGNYLHIHSSEGHARRDFGREVKKCKTTAGRGWPWDGWQVRLVKVVDIAGPQQQP